MILGPGNNALDLWPVGDITEIDQAQRCASDYQPIEVLILNILKVAIEVVQVLGGGIFDSRLSTRSN